MKAPGARPWSAAPTAFFCLGGSRPERPFACTDLTASSPGCATDSRCCGGLLTPRDSLPSIGAPGGYHDPRGGEERRSRPSLCAVDPDPMARRAPRHVLTALACARALLDELETVLDDERTRSDVVIQVAEQLARLANMMNQWKAAAP